MYDSHFILASVVEFQHKQILSYLMRFWLSDRLSQILFNEAKY